MMHSMYQHVNYLVMCFLHVYLDHSPTLLGSVPLPNNPSRLSNQFRTSADRCTPTLPRQALG